MLILYCTLWVTASCIGFITDLFVLGSVRKLNSFKNELLIIQQFPHQCFVSTGISWIVLSRKCGFQSNYEKCVYTLISYKYLQSTDWHRILAAFAKIVFVFLFSWVGNLEVASPDSKGICLSRYFLHLSTYRLSHLNV